MRLTVKFPANGGRTRFIAPLVRATANGGDYDVFIYIYLYTYIMYLCGTRICVSVRDRAKCSRSIKLRMTYMYPTILCITYRAIMTIIAHV